LEADGQSRVIAVAVAAVATVVVSPRTSDAGRSGEPCSLCQPLPPPPPPPPPPVPPDVAATAAATLSAASMAAGGGGINAVTAERCDSRRTVASTPSTTLFCDPARNRLVLELRRDRKPLFIALDMCSGHTT